MFSSLILLHIKQSCFVFVLKTSSFFIKIFQSGFAVGIQPDSKRKHKAITVVCLLGKTEDY
ncbi:hypothetical protein BACCOP_02661 [Phocaeicola coprocola DSM 17136]|uniref:Uncharacterized protein n=1 Tax=Phocaeicola coprocola DSM 17136 TaxID=470145 RepID=B3JL77_9BACT|nr:hypothetical protein BACCOP_02661 [Phocaeicola coprocola DSM 17136]